MSIDHPAENRGQRTLAAIVLTDAVGFSARMSIDEENTLSLIHADLKLIETLCHRFEGQVIKSMGDGILMYFVSAVQAVSCSLEIQQQLHQRHQEETVEQPLQHRIGVHLGDVFFKNSDVMGNGVNIAARLQTEAHPGGICISKIAYDVVKSRLTLNAAYAGPLQLKNIREPQPAYHLYLPGTVPPAAKAAPILTEIEPDFSLEKPVSPAESEEAIAQRHRLVPGSKVAGRYKVQRVLGQGGFGRSYLVEDTQRFGELCVLKEFFPTNTSKRSLQKALALFKREAKTLYQINHPQIPTFMACFTQGKRLFIVQEYINGVTYAQLLKQRKREGRCFSAQEVIRWLVHMLQVLDYLHTLNVVHRDISPDNIMYSSDRELPILIDFGLVNDAMGDILSGNHEGDQEEGRGKSATIVGKYGYSPPEQMQLGQCSPCSDLYALGVTAIVLMTGKYPRELIDRGSLEWDWQHHVECPRPLFQLLVKMTRQRPKERFQSAKAVLEQVIALDQNASSPLPARSLQPIDLTIEPTVAPFYGEPGPGGTSAVQDADFIEQCRKELTRSIGPIASVLIEDALEQHPEASPQELVMVLAAQLSDGQQANDFTSRIYGKSEIANDYRSGPLTTAARNSNAVSLGDAIAGIDANFLKRCHRALTESIGPMADFLIEETLADYPNLTPQGLVLQLAAEIPDHQKAKEFKQRLL